MGRLELLRSLVAANAVCAISARNVTGKDTPILQGTIRLLRQGRRIGDAD